MSTRPLVELLYFEGCPNVQAARELVEYVASALELEAELRMIKVADEDSALRLRFVGSPTVRVNGQDVDPTAENQRDYGLSCRAYQTERGFAGLPEERLVRDALRIMSLARPTGARSDCRSRAGTAAAPAWARTSAPTFQPAGYASG